MYWQIPLILAIIIGHLIVPFLIKRITQLPSRTRNLVWQYFFCALFATIIAFITGTKFFDKQFLIIAIIGIFNAFGCYCQWRAIDLSLSKTSLFTQADDLIAIALGYIILHEASFLNPMLGLGVITCISSAVIFACNEWYAKIHTYSHILKWVAGYSIIWGIACFSMRYFSLKDMPILSYIAAWYQGSLCGALLILIFSSRKEKGETLTFQKVIRVIPLATTIWICLTLTYWVFILAPITVAQPIFQVSEMIFPTIIGLWIFKEIKELNRLTQIAMIIGLAGGIIIMFSY